VELRGVPEDPDRTGIGVRGALPQEERSGPLRSLVPTSLVSNTRLEGPLGLSEPEELLPPAGAYRITGPLCGALEGGASAAEGDGAADRPG
jgi:hypothetical protein